MTVPRLTPRSRSATRFPAERRIRGASRRRAAPGLAIAVLAALPGCVERRISIRTDPPGAIVALEDEPVEGRTPVEVPYEFVGVRRVTLAAPGHVVLQTTADVASRWYDWFPLDFFAHFLWPGQITDVQTFEYRLEPYVPTERALTDEETARARERLAEVSARADEYRAAGSVGPGGTEPVVEAPVVDRPAGAAGGAGAGPGGTTSPGPGSAPAAGQALPEIPRRSPPPREARALPEPPRPGEPLPPPVKPIPLEADRSPDAPRQAPAPPAPPPAEPAKK